MELVQNSPQRPWQGTILAILNIIGLVFSFFIVVVLFAALLFGAAFLEPYMGNIDLPVSLGITAVLLIVMAFIVPFSILYIFITVGIFKGAKWAIIAHLVLTALGLLGNFTAMHFMAILFQAFIVYACIVCLKDPYYNVSSI